MRGEKRKGHKKFVDFFHPIKYTLPAKGVPFSNFFVIFFFITYLSKDHSLHGTFVNGEKIDGFEKKQILLSGDVISILRPKSIAFSFRDY